MTTKKEKIKKQRTTWLMTHKYPNGYIRAGIVRNTKLGDIKIDVIAFEENFVNKYIDRHQVTHMTPEEAIAHANCLLMAVEHWNLEKE